MKIIKESKVRPPKRYGLTLDESVLSEASTHAMPNSMKMGKKSGESFAVVVAVDQLKYKEEEGLDRTSAFTKAVTLSREKPTAYVAVISSDDPRLAEFSDTKPNDKDANGQAVTQESLITEDSDIPVESQPGPQMGPQAGLASMLNTAIQDEWKTIDFYNSLSITATAEGYEDISKVIEDITTEEVKHVGQLQAALATLSPNTDAIQAGEREGEEQLGTEVAPEAEEL